MKKTNTIIPKNSPRLLAIHDLSGHSQVSLMAIIPILTTLGIKVTALPTAILSSNTELKDYQFVDFSPYFLDFVKHWEKLNLSFSAIYTGFLGSEEIIQLISKVISTFSTKGQLVVIDPVMGDDGNLYPCFNEKIVSAMRKLIFYADVITPNLTEAALLINEPYPKEPDTRLIRSWCQHLGFLGPRFTVITGIPLKNKPDKTQVVFYDKNESSFQRFTCPYLPVNYPGTGDIFTAALTGYLLNGFSFPRAVKLTTSFILKAIRITIRQATPPEEGLCLEKALSFLKTS